MTNRDSYKDHTSNRVLSLDSVFRIQRIYSLKCQVSGTSTENGEDRFNAMGYNLNFERLGAHLYNSIWYNDFPDEFEAASGSMWEVLGFREVGTHNSYSFRKPLEKVNFIDVYGGIKGRFDYNETLRERYLWAGIESSLERVWTKFGFFQNLERVNQQDYRYSGFEYELWNSPIQSLEYFLSALWGGAAHYSEGFTGWRIRLAGNAIVKPLRRLVYVLNVSREDFYTKYKGKRCYLQTIVWNKVSYMIMRSMFLRGIYQYNDFDDSSNASLLFAYEYYPLSNFYIGVNFNELNTFDTIENRLEAFLKVSYFWRL
jgi:hypothetical protein